MELPLLQREPGPKRLILGIMLASGLLSGWISNTATTLMMLPVALALCHELPGPKSMRALLLGLAYSASIGGIATPIGTSQCLEISRVTRKLLSMRHGT